MTKTQPEKVQLNEVELLKLENSSLKLDRAAKAIEDLKVKQRALFDSIEARLAVDDISKYSINPRTGEGTRITKGTDNVEA